MVFPHLLFSPTTLKAAFLSAAAASHSSTTVTIPGAIAQHSSAALSPSGVNALQSNIQTNTASASTTVAGTITSGNPPAGTISLHTGTTGVSSTANTSLSSINNPVVSSSTSSPNIPWMTVASGLVNQQVVTTTSSLPIVSRPLASNITFLSSNQSRKLSTATSSSFPTAIIEVPAFSQTSGSLSTPVSGSNHANWGIPQTSGPTSKVLIATVDRLTQNELSDASLPNSTSNSSAGQNQAFLNQAGITLAAALMSSGEIADQKQQNLFPGKSDQTIQSRTSCVTAFPSRQLSPAASTPHTPSLEITSGSLVNSSVVLLSANDSPLSQTQASTTVSSQLQQQHSTHKRGKQQTVSAARSRTPNYLRQANPPLSIADLSQQQATSVMQSSSPAKLTDTRHFMQQQQHLSAQVTVAKQQQLYTLQQQIFQPRLQTYPQENLATVQIQSPQQQQLLLFQQQITPSRSLSHPQQHQLLQQQEQEQYNQQYSHQLHIQQQQQRQQQQHKPQQKHPSVSLKPPIHQSSTDLILPQHQVIPHVLSPRAINTGCTFIANTIAPAASCSLALSTSSPVSFTSTATTVTAPTDIFTGGITNAISEPFTSNPALTMAASVASCVGQTYSAGVAKVLPSRQSVASINVQPSSSPPFSSRILEPGDLLPHLVSLGTPHVALKHLIATSSSVHTPTITSTNLSGCHSTPCLSSNSLQQRNLQPVPSNQPASAFSSLYTSTSGLGLAAMPVATTSCLSQLPVSSVTIQPSLNSPIGLVPGVGCVGEQSLRRVRSPQILPHVPSSGYGTLSGPTTPISISPPSSVDSCSGSTHSSLPSSSCTGISGPNGVAITGSTIGDLGSSAVANLVSSPGHSQAHSHLPSAGGSLSPLPAPGLGMAEALMSHLSGVVEPGLAAALSQAVRSGSINSLIPGNSINGGGANCPGAGVEGRGMSGPNETTEAALASYLFRLSQQLSGPGNSPAAAVAAAAAAAAAAVARVVAPNRQCSSQPSPLSVVSTCSQAPTLLTNQSSLLHNSTESRPSSVQSPKTITPPIPSISQIPACSTCIIPPVISSLSGDLDSSLVISPFLASGASSGPSGSIGVIGGCSSRAQTPNLSAHRPSPLLGLSVNANSANSASAVATATATLVASSGSGVSSTDGPRTEIASACRLPVSLSDTCGGFVGDSDATASLKPTSGNSNNQLSKVSISSEPACTAPQNLGPYPTQWDLFFPAYPLVWQGRLSLKNSEARVALHYVQGNHELLRSCMALLAAGGGGSPQASLVQTGGPLRIVQRMRLEPAQLEGVQRKLAQAGASCACLALAAGEADEEKSEPGGSGAAELFARDGIETDDSGSSSRSCPVGQRRLSESADLLRQAQILTDGFIRYMQDKMAAGIINVSHPGFPLQVT